MNFLAFKCADQMFVATQLHPDVWTVTVSDNHTGKSHVFHCPDEEFNALVTLAINGDDEKVLITSELYAIAERALEGCPKECRPIP